MINTADQVFAPSQVMFEQPPPLLAHGFRYGGIAIAGQVNQVGAAGQTEKIDELGPAGRLADEGQPGVPCQGIDGTGFSGIGTAGEGNFRGRRRGRRQIDRFGDRGLENGVAKQRGRHGDRQNKGKLR